MTERFTVLESFKDRATGSMYCKGLTYTVRNDKLAAKVAKWKNQGKVAPALEERGVARLRGKGVVE